MNAKTMGSIWRVWDLQVQTILDDQYVELEKYYKTLKTDRPELWDEFVAKMGGEENALLFDSKKYVLNQSIPITERHLNYARTLFTFLEVFKPNLGLIALTDHNYYDTSLLDVLFNYGTKSCCKCICGVEINASGVHMLVYFEEPPYQKSNFSDGIKTFLDSIGVNEPKENGTLTVSSKSVIDVIEEVEKSNGIYIFPHCNSSNGLFQERGRTDRTHLANIFNLKPIIFLQCHTKEGATKTEEYIKIKGDAFKSNYIFSISKDSRCLKEIGGADEKGNYNWVKSDCHFNGLRQVLIESDRVFIGEEPELTKRVRTNPTKFIGSLSVKKIASINANDIWFNDFHVELNSGLVAIIGNKGAGKSAITDILGLCGNTHQDPSNFSFLTSSKFRKVKPENLSEKFEEQIVWKDGTSVRRMLNENPDRKLPERVRYIPQNFLEKLCTNVESDDFEKEIKQIIFLHTPAEYKHSKSSLDELISYKSNLVMEEIDKTKSSISKLNLLIVASELKSSDHYKTEIENAIILKQNELAAHKKIEPEKPVVENLNAVSSKSTKKIADLRFKVERIESEIESITAKRASHIANEEQLSQALQYFTSLNESVAKAIADTNPNIQTLHHNGIQVNSVFTYSLDTKPIEDTLAIIRKEIAEMNDSLNELLPGSKKFSLKAIIGEIKELQDELDQPAKLQQKYIDELKSWETQKKAIEGSATIEGSLFYLINHLTYIDKELTSVLEEQYKERYNLVNQLFDQKQALIKIRKALFQPVTDFIENFKELKAKYDVKLNVTLEHHTFLDGFFSFVNQGRIGSFNGREEGYKRITDLLEKAHFDSHEGFIEFTSELLNNLKEDYRTEARNPVAIETQLKKGGELHLLYDFIFHFDYLQPFYNLNLGNKSLLELSPGERGALLLIFYLILDKDDIPLLIDQPEENLDNESVYHILVHFIKKVKDHRQIIIVTHNPNLAVVCDAEQIIHMNIDKENKNTVSFHSGSIENSIINHSAVNILEGTLPAFNNRDSKYIRSNTSKVSI
jgi:ABC-type lipoprotein export system ATPase subunit